VKELGLYAVAMLNGSQEVWSGMVIVMGLYEVEMLNGRRQVKQIIVF